MLLTLGLSPEFCRHGGDCLIVGVEVVVEVMLTTRIRPSSPCTMGVFSEIYLLSISVINSPVERRTVWFITDIVITHVYYIHGNGTHVYYRHGNSTHVY